MASTGATVNAVIIIGAILLLCSLHIDAKPRYNDVDNCGKCKHKCPRAPPHSERTCKNGKCGTKCKRGWLDCDRKKANGCEVDEKTLKTDVKNCGSCGSVCPTGQVGTGVATCTDGVCGHASTCGKDFADCDGDPSNGCESAVKSDVKNCGSCGNVCPVPLTNQRGSGEATCTDGVCGYTLTCAKDWADCDGDPSNGCETDLVGIFSSIYNCGSCDHVCPPFQNSTIWSICDAGVCGYECNFFLGNLGNCDNDASNGCEINHSIDVNNCGACDRVCFAPPKGQIGCSGGVCTGNCLKGWFDNCDGNANNGCEQDVMSDVNHCGSCGFVCPSPPNATPMCIDSTCKFTCNAGFSDCDAVASNGCEVHGVCPL